MPSSWILTPHRSRHKFQAKCEVRRMSQDFECFFVSGHICLRFPGISQSLPPALPSVGFIVKPHLAPLCFTLSGTLGHCWMPGVCRMIHTMLHNSISSETEKEKRRCGCVFNHLLFASLSLGDLRQSLLVILLSETVIRRVCRDKSPTQHLRAGQGNLSHEHLGALR